MSDEAKMNNDPPGDEDDWETVSAGSSSHNVPFNVLCAVGEDSLYQYQHVNKRCMLRPGRHSFLREQALAPPLRPDLPTPPFLRSIPDATDLEYYFTPGYRSASIVHDLASARYTRSEPQFRRSSSRHLGQTRASSPGWWRTGSVMADFGETRSRWRTAAEIRRCLGPGSGSRPRARR